MNGRILYRVAHRPLGMVLPTALVFLLILTIASLMIVEQISSQTRMAGNAAAAQQTLQVAEATMRTAIDQLINATPARDQFQSNANGLYYYRASNYSTTTALPWKTDAGWTTAIPTIKFGPKDTTTERKYIIEMLPDVRGPGSGMTGNQKVYRITARVIGVGGQGSVMLQTLYKI